MNVHPTDRMFPAATAEDIATRVDASDPAWTRLGLAATLGLVLDPAGAEDLADRILDAFPREPVDRRGTLARYLASIRPPKVPDDPVSATGTGARSIGTDLLFAVPLTPRRWDDLPAIDDLAALAGLLDLTVGELDWFADRRNWLRSTTGPLQHYRRRVIAKSSGRRLLEIPKPRLREIQRRLLRRIVAHVPQHPVVHGFRSGRGPLTHAAPHAGVEAVARLDLVDFFTRVGRGRVRAVFATVGYPAAVAGCLADLCTTATPIAGLAELDPQSAGWLRGRHLPQGAPTSPALANLALRRLDRRITGYAGRHDLNYTRYADDIALSGDTGAVAAALSMVQRIVADEGFAVNRDKTAVMFAHQRQQLTGLVVNDRPRAGRREYDALRALLYNAARTGAAMQNRGSRPHFREYVHGRIAWVGAGDRRRLELLRALAAGVDWDG